MAASLAFWILWTLAAVLVAFLAFASWYGPNQDISNLSRWVWLLGWRSPPAWFRERTADWWTLRGGIAVLALLVVAGGLRLFWSGETSASAPEPAPMQMPEIQRPPLVPPDPRPESSSGRPDRNIDAELQTAILLHVPKTKQVNILTLRGDPEGGRFADQIEAFLKSEGYRVGPRVAFLMSGDKQPIGTAVYPDEKDPNVINIRVGLNDR